MSKLVNNILLYNIEIIRNINLFILKNKLLTTYLIKKVIKLKSKSKIKKKQQININYLQNKPCFRKERNHKTVNSCRPPIILVFRTKYHIEL